MARRPVASEPSKRQRTRGAQHTSSKPKKATGKKATPRKSSGAKKASGTKKAKSKKASPQKKQSKSKKSKPKRKSTELVALGSGNGGASSGAEPDPLGDFLRNRSGVHERLGEPIPSALLRNGAIGAALLMLAALVFSIFPDPGSMRDSTFLILGDHLAADVTQAGQGFAGVLFVAGALLLLIDATLAAAKPRLPVEAHYACAGQLALGAGAVVPAGLVALILIGSLVFWIGLVCLGLAALGFFLGE